MSEGHTENRTKIVRVAPEAIIELVNWRLDLPDYIALPKHERIPDDVRVIGVRFDWPTQFFEFRIWHESFEIVPEGDIPPLIPDFNYVTEWRHVSFAEVADAAGV